MAIDIFSIPQLGRNLHANDEQVRFPAPIPELSTSRVLVMSWLSGTHVQRLATSKIDECDREELARQFARVFAAKDWEEVIRGFPRIVRVMMALVRKQNFAVQIQHQHQHLEPSVNRLVFGMMVSSLFVGSALLWANSVPPLLGGVSVFGISGCRPRVDAGLSSVSCDPKIGHVSRRVSKYRYLCTP
jgi:ABC1 atypical kinase-like domain